MTVPHAGNLLSSFAKGGIAMLCIGPRKIFFFRKKVKFHISLHKNGDAQVQELEKSYSKPGKGRGKKKGR